MEEHSPMKKVMEEHSQTRCNYMTGIRDLGDEMHGS